MDLAVAADQAEVQVEYLHHGLGFVEVEAGRWTGIDAVAAEVAPAMVDLDLEHGYFTSIPNLL
jgi:hypothetical protein